MTEPGVDAAERCAPYQRRTGTCNPPLGRRSTTTEFSSGEICCTMKLLPLPLPIVTACCGSTVKVFSALEEVMHVCSGSEADFRASRWLRQLRSHQRTSQHNLRMAAQTQATSNRRMHPSALRQSRMKAYEPSANESLGNRTFIKTSVERKVSRTK